MCAFNVTRRESRATNPIEGRYYDWPVGYQPGGRLADVWQLEEHHLGAATFTHWPEGTAHKNRMQGNDYVQSQMYVKGVRCSACHDVHGTEHPADLRLPGNAVCTAVSQSALQPGPRGTVEFHTQHAARQRGQQVRRVPHARCPADHCERECPEPHVQVHFADDVGPLRRAEPLHVVSQGQVQRVGHRSLADPGRACFPGGSPHDAQGSARRTGSRPMVWNESRPSWAWSPYLRRNRSLRSPKSGAASSVHPI